MLLLQGPLSVTAWEDSGMTRFAFLHFGDNVPSPCVAVLHDCHCRWLTLRSERAKRDRDMLEDSQHAASRQPRSGAVVRVLLS